MTPIEDIVKLMKPGVATCTAWLILRPTSLEPGGRETPTPAYVASKNRSVESATPHEVTLVNVTLAERFVTKVPARLIGDNAYESDTLDLELAQRGVELIAPHRRNRKRKTQDGRPLRRYRRRWKVERLFAWLQNFRRIVVRYERNPENLGPAAPAAACARAAPAPGPWHGRNLGHVVDPGA